MRQRYQFVSHKPSAGGDGDQVPGEPEGRRHAAGAQAKVPAAQGLHGQGDTGGVRTVGGLSAAPAAADARNRPLQSTGTAAETSEPV